MESTAANRGPGMTPAAVTTSAAVSTSRVTTDSVATVAPRPGIAGTITTAIRVSTIAPEALEISSNRPSNNLDFRLESIISLGDFNLTINGPLRAGRYQIFRQAGAGCVLFENNLSDVFPDWWGFASSATVADNDTALQAALDTRRNVSLPYSTSPFQVGGPLRYYSRQIVYGAGWNYFDRNDVTNTVLRATTANHVFVPANVPDFTDGAHLRDFTVNLGNVATGGISMECCRYCRTTSIFIDRIPDGTWVSDEGAEWGCFGIMTKGREEVRPGDHVQAPYNIIDGCVAQGSGESPTNNVGFLVASTSRSSEGTSSANRFRNCMSRKLGRGFDVANGGANLIDSPEVSKCSVGIYNRSNNTCVINLYAEDCDDAVIYDDHDRDESGNKGDLVLMNPASFARSPVVFSGPSGYSIKMLDSEQTPPVHGRYDVALHGGASRGYRLGMIPRGAVIKRAWYEEGVT